MKIQTFTFNPFGENTYVLYEDGKAVVVDPGMSNSIEQQEFDDFIVREGLELTDCWLTHAHIDHVMGCDYVFRTYGHIPKLHPDDQSTLGYSKRAAEVYGVPYTESPTPDFIWKHGMQFHALGTKVEVRFTPGHAPGHVIFVFPEHDVVIGGDVLFAGSVGRTDLPGGDAGTLAMSIETQCYSLPDSMKVYSGHGPATSIGEEKRANPFVNADKSGLLQRK